MQRITTSSLFYLNIGACFLLTFAVSSNRIVASRNESQPDQWLRDTFASDADVSVERTLRNQNSHGPGKRVQREIYMRPHYFPRSYYNSLDPLLYQEAVSPPQIIHLVAPRKRSKDTGVAELLAVLAPLAAIPLIGSAAMTTFTTLFATGAYGGRRRKRNVVSEREKLLHDSSFGGNKKEFENYRSLLANNDDAGQWKALKNNPMVNENRFARTRLVRLSFEDAAGKMKQTFGNRKDETRIPMIHDLSFRELNTNQSDVHVLEKLKSRGKISGNQNGHKILGKRDERESNGKWEHNKSLGKELAYRSKADTGTVFESKNYNNSVESKEWKEKERKKLDDDAGVEMESTDTHDTFGKMRFKDLNAQESGAATAMKTTRGAGKQKREENNDRFDFNSWIPFLANPYLADGHQEDDGKRELDIIQKYLNDNKKVGRPDYNDEIIATYLSCSGMLQPNNHCLERLTCQFSDSQSGIKQLEKDVASVVIYSLLKNNHIDNEFKTRLQQAAFFGRDNPGRCAIYVCPKTSHQLSRKTNS